MDLLNQIGNLQGLIENLGGSGESNGESRNRKLTGYEQIMRKKQSLYETEREYRQLRMQENYPKNFITIHSLMLFILALVLLILQIFLTINNGVMASYGFGIWLAIYYFIAIGVTLLTIFIKQYKFLLAAIMMHMFALFLTAFLIVILNIVAITRYSCTLWFTNQACVASEYLRSIHVALIIFGILCFMASLVFIIYLQVSLFNCCDYGVTMDEDVMMPTSMQPRVVTTYPTPSHVTRKQKSSIRNVDPLARVYSNPVVTREENI